MNFYLVRYGAMRGLATFKYSEGVLIPSQKVIVRTERGLELGTVVSRTDPDETRVNVSKMGTILRKVTREDQKRLDDIENRQAPEELRYAREKVAELKLPMKIIYVEHLFAGDRIVFYFLANGRVDFRKLVKELARNYQTRIELKQIGVRDEARLLSDYEHCGRELCCRSWIRKLQPVTMKLAKNQKATLDPTKISGGCGRLMCCLRYEDKTYEDLRKNLPPKKSFVRTSQGDGEVVDFDVLTQTVVLCDKSGKRFMVAAEDIQGPASRGRAGSPAKEKEAAAPKEPAADADDQGREGRAPEDGNKSAASRSSAAAPTKGRKRRNRSGRNKRRGENRPSQQDRNSGGNRAPGGEAPPASEKQDGKTQNNKHPKKKHGRNNRSGRG